MSAPALFLPQPDEGGRTLLLPNRCARSVWSLELVHGAAVAALLARGVEAALRPELRVVRLTIDLMRPAPMQALEARTVVVREGRRIQVVQSGLFTSRGDGGVGRGGAGDGACAAAVGPADRRGDRGRCGAAARPGVAAGAPGAHDRGGRGVPLDGRVAAGGGVGGVAAADAVDPQPGRHRAGGAAESAVAGGWRRPTR